MESNQKKDIYMCVVFDRLAGELVTLVGRNVASYALIIASLVNKLKINNAFCVDIRHCSQAGSSVD